MASESLIVVLKAYLIPLLGSLNAPVPLQLLSFLNKLERARFLNLYIYLQRSTNKSIYMKQTVERFPGGGDV